MVRVTVRGEDQEMCGREPHPRVGVEGVAGGQRLGLDHVERGPGHAPVVERPQQRVLVDQRTPGHVDQVDAGP